MNRLRIIRQEKELSGVDVAARLNITPQHYYDLERGRRDVTDKLAEKIADVFDVSVDYLRGRSNERNGAPNFRRYAAQIAQLEELARQHGFALDDDFVDRVARGLELLKLVGGK